MFLLDQASIADLYQLNEREGVDDKRIILSDESNDSLEFTRKSLNESIRCLAGKLNGCLNMDEGVSYAVIMPNCAECIVTFLAIAYGGGVNCLLNPKYGEEEIEYAIKDMGCRMIIVSGNGHQPAENVGTKLNLPIAKINFVTKNQPPSITIKNQDGNWIEHTKTQSNIKPNGSNIVLKLHTSGTTSKPKIVPLRQQNIVISCFNMLHTYKWDSSKDKSVLVMPLYHVHGLLNGCLAPLAFGIPVAILKTQFFSKHAFWEAVEKYEPTWVTAVPSIWQILMNDADGSNAPKINCLRYIRACSSAMAEATALEAEKLFQCPVLEAYAMTEATHQMCSNEPSDRKLGSVGYPQGIDLAIIDPTNASIVEQGLHGEICVRGYNVIQEYQGLTKEQNDKNFHLPEAVNCNAQRASVCSNSVSIPQSSNVIDIATAYQSHKLENKILGDYNAITPLKSFPWLRTGDVGYMDESGRIFLVARIKELINRGGEKISPLEIDSVLLECPEVQEAATYGADHPILGEVPHACVVIKTGQKDWEVVDKMRVHCTERLAKFKVPECFYICSELPKGPTGKVLRRELKEFVVERNLTAVTAPQQ